MIKKITFSIIFILLALVALSQSAVVDSIFFNDGLAAATPAEREIDGRWCSLGTSITWYNDHLDRAKGKITAGYQTRVMEKLKFRNFTNGGVNGGTVANAVDQVVFADYYTIELGINDWGKKVVPGTFDDYLIDSGNGTFAANYRKLIDRIYRTNPDARIVICTPRKGYGYDGYLPDKWSDALDGHYLSEYVDIVRKIAEYEGIPVADFFGDCGGQNNLHRLSMDTALHPNDEGYQLMANVLVQALTKVVRK